MQIPEQVLNDTMTEFLGPWKKNAVTVDEFISEEL